ncbi:HEAT repeat domain-containing protein [Promethearchaeum syntrophicum]|uniref:HEAT repeat domain-containing protein n=1 Tax=Promethearchaeum syntrophicum TaxID=2594042 RepID=A0A5B9D5J6_9ARCH|nr:HEAT repeat domain-containing protein [Candidatus Prometheoarchaeum syntrophicum]QEE14332.1 hypothetical protein DSAG12_00145 [Candidatus Prometheoarchaeum syntrophicum]
MKIFQDKARIIQLADKKMIEGWNAEMPLLFIGYIREKRITTYPKSVQKEVNAYLDDVLENSAIPMLLTALNNPDVEIRKNVAKSIVQVSENNPSMLKIALSHMEQASNDKNKEVSDAMKKALKNYQKYLKRLQTAAKRKQLAALRKKMDEIDTQFAEGQISDNNYIREQKNYLKLKREIELEEIVD